MKKFYIDGEEFTIFDFIKVGIGILLFILVCGLSNMMWS